MRRSTCNPNGDRKTMTVCDCHDLGALSAFGLPNAKPPFLAAANEPSINASFKSIPPRSCRSLANASSIFVSVPFFIHRWKRRWRVWYGGYLSGSYRHCAPVRRIHKIPSSTSRVSFQGRPRLSGHRLGSGINGSIIFHCVSVRSINTIDQKIALLSISYQFLIYFPILTHSYL